MQYRKHRSCQPKNGKRTSAESFSSDDYVASLLKHFTLQSWLAGYILTVPAVKLIVYLTVVSFLGLSVIRSENGKRMLLIDGRCYRE